MTGHPEIHSLSAAYFVKQIKRATGRLSEVAGVFHFSDYSVKHEECGSPSFYGAAASDRADLVRLPVIDHSLFLNHVPPYDRLSHRVDLIIVGAIRKRRAFLDEVGHPRNVKRLRKVKVA